MVAPVPVRYFVLLTALLVCSTALAGCHDLPNTFSDNGLDAGDSQDQAEADGTDATEEDPGDTGGDDGGNGGGNDGGDGGGNEGGDDGDDGDDGGDDGGDDNTDEGGEEDGNETDEELPVVEEGNFAEDHMVEINENDDILAGCDEDVFEPATMEIEVGESVRWKNQGCQSHTATSGDEFGEHDDLFDTGSISTDEESENSYRFNEVGTYKYYCKFHPGMTVAEIVVS